MSFFDMGLGDLIGGVAGGIGGLLAGNQQAGANKEAGFLQALFAAQALQAQQAMYGEAKGIMQPWMTGGSKMFSFLQDALMGKIGPGMGPIGGGGKSLLSTFEPTMAQLAKTPGYQFTLDQGTRAAQNAAAGKGLGFSGNAIKAGVDYAGGLASTTFQQQLQNYMAQNQQAYNMLLGPSQMGAGAAGTMAGIATNVGQGLAGDIMAFGNALAGGTMGAGNARAGGINALASGIGNIGYSMPQGTTLSGVASPLSGLFTNVLSQNNLGPGQGVPRQNLFANPYELNPAMGA